MRPVYLSIEGINSFVEKCEIDFDAVTADRIFCISGPTGSGKTTILDCIVIALYAPRAHNRGTMRDYVNMNCDKGKIVFRFTFEQGLYEIERTVKRTGTGGTTAKLTRLDTNEVLADLSDKATEKIEEMLKLTFDDFTKVVILEQGQFAKFMKSAPSERNHAVAQLFDLTRFEALKDKFNAATKKYEEANRENARQIAAYDGVSEQKIGEAESAEKLCRKKAEQQKIEREKLNKQLLATESARADYEAVSKAQAGKTAAEEAIRRFGEEKENLRTRKEALSVQKKGLILLKEQADLARDMSGKIAESERDLAAVKDYEQKLKQLADEYKAVDAQQKETDAQIKSILNEKAQTESELAGTMRNIGALVEKANIFADLPSDAAALSALSAQLAGHATAAKNAEKRIREAEAEANKAREDKLCAEGQNLLTQKKAAELQAKRAAAEQDKAEAEKRREAALKNNAAATLSHTLGEGDVCPVCGGTVGKKRVCVAEENLADFGEKIERAAKALREVLDEEKRNDNVQVQSLATLRNADEKIAEAHLRAKAAEEEKASALSGLSDVTTLEKAADLLRHAASLAGRVAQKEKAEKDCLPGKTRLSEQLSRVTEEGKRVKSEKEALTERIVQRLALAEPLSAELLDEFKQRAKQTLSAYESGEKKVESERESLERDEKANASNLSSENTKRSACILTLSEKGDVKYNAGDGAILNERLSALNGEISAQDGEAAALAAEAKSLKEKLQQKKRLTDEGKRLSKKLTAVTTLKKLFEGDRFLGFAAEEYIQAFTESAGAILSGLTDGKYTLEYESGKTSDFWVRDFLNGNERRKVKTLSGGETFLASMSVAIAISREIAAGRSFEFFFLDEGFGTLHEKAIDTVAVALKKLSEETIVGLVSHRSELVERISSRIVVSPATEERGSTLEFVCG